MAAPKKKATKSAKPRLAPDGIMQLGLGFWGSKTLLSAIELGLFTELAHGPGRSEGAAAATRAARPERAGLLRRARLARDAPPQGNDLFQHAGVGPLSRPRQAFLYRRDPRDGGGSPLRFLGLAD